MIENCSLLLPKGENSLSSFSVSFFMFEQNDKWCIYKNRQIGMRRSGWGSDNSNNKSINGERKKNNKQKTTSASNQWM